MAQRFNANYLVSNTGLFNKVYADNLFDQTISLASGYLSGQNYSGNYDGGYFLGRINLFEAQRNVIPDKIGDNFSIVNVDSTDPHRFKQVVMSSDGKYMTAVQGNTLATQTGNIFVSNNNGQSWKKIENPGASRWFGVAMSSDGKYQSAIIFNGVIWRSENYGIDWEVARNQNSTDNNYVVPWSAITLSSDGQTQIASTFNVSASNALYTSTNYGKNFYPLQSPNQFNAITDRTMRGVGMNGNGKYRIAATYYLPALNASGNIYLSKDFGASWSKVPENKIPNDCTRAFMNASISNQGKIQVVCTQGNKDTTNKGIFISYDYGETWTGVGPTGINFDAVASLNEDGSNMVACAYYGKSVELGTSDNLVNKSTVYVSNNYGRTWISKEQNRNWTSIAISNSSKYIAATVYGSSGIFISKTPEFIDGDFYADNIYTANLTSNYPASTGIRRYLPESTVTLASSTPSTGLICYFPFVLKKDAINPNICIESVGNGSDTSISVGIYSGAGFEGARLAYSGVISALNTNVPRIERLNTNITLSKGSYILASCNTGQSSPLTFRTILGNAFVNLFGIPTGMRTLLDGSSSTASDMFIFESGFSNLRTIIGTGSYSRISNRAPAICLEY